MNNIGVAIYIVSCTKFQLIGVAIYSYTKLYSHRYSYLASSQVYRYSYTDLVLLDMPLHLVLNISCKWHMHYNYNV